uniref:Uncharacterized protein n=1 Tax=Rhizophora mucronata TaxID=61149 RepID=A0A2P2QVL6_RHIMU
MLTSIFLSFPDIWSQFLF